MKIIFLTDEQHEQLLEHIDFVWDDEPDLENPFNSVHIKEEQAIWDAIKHPNDVRVCEKAVKADLAAPKRKRAVARRTARLAFGVR